jgi:hypothetical protein
VVNHEKTVSKLAEALSRIADNLPRVKLAAELYPTRRMQAAVAELNAYVVRFLIRARGWYLQSTWKHLLHSVTQPPELLYDDLLNHITRCSEAVRELAVSGQQVEFRHMHSKIDEVHAKLDSNFARFTSRLDEIVVAVNCKNGLAVVLISRFLTLIVHSSAMITTNHRISDLQFSQIMRSISDTNIMDPRKALHFLQAANRRTLHHPTSKLSKRFLSSPILKKWSSSAHSEISIVKGNFRSRLALRNFCVEVIEQLQSSQAPVSVVFAMHVPQADNSPSISTTDLFKHLIRQTLSLRQNHHTEKSMSLCCAHFYGNTSEKEWFQLLESALADIGRPVYLIIDLELLNRDHSPPQGFSWLSAFLAFFDRLSNLGHAHYIKVLLISYSAELPFQLSVSEHLNFVIQAKANMVTKRQWPNRMRGCSIKLR